MAFKEKFKSLINIKDRKSSDQDVLSTELMKGPGVGIYKHQQVELPNDPRIDREIIDSIEGDYFNDETFDASEFELQKQPEQLKLDEIDQDRTRLRRQLQAVSKKVSELVLENHPAYATELTRVMELQATLQNASAICADGRRQLAMAKKGFTTASLGLLKNYRKRQQFVSLLKSLRTIKTLQRTDIRLREMLEEEDYAGAIQLCLECQKAASTFRHYHCISELSSKLQDTLEMIEEQLDVALSKTCNNFDTKHYEKVQTAYRLLGKTQTAMDQLHMHFTSAIHNTAFTIVLGYVELTSGTGDSNFQKRQYADLCKHVTSDTFTPCLLDLCKALWEVMKSYHQTMDWHEQHDRETDAGSDSSSSSANVEATFNRRYIRQKLEHGLGRIWQDVQQKVKAYILGSDLSGFKFDEFIQVLDLVNKLIHVGEEFCNSKSEGLQDSLRQQSLNYFRNYHRARMDELTMFFENEGWQLCPVKSSFSLIQLHEFKFLRHQLHRSPSTSSSQSQSQVDGLKHTTLFERYKTSGSPFDLQAEEEEKEDVLATNGYDLDGMQDHNQDDDSDSDIPDELKQDYIDEQTGEMPRRISLPRARRASFKSGGKLAPIVTNTTLNVIRLFGKYMQMMAVLKPIAFDVILCMSQLFDFYLYTVYSFFAQDSEDTHLSSKLQTTLKRIRDNLILNPEDGAPGVNSSSVIAVQVQDERKMVEDKVPHPHISPMVDLTNVGTLYGLSERIVAAESLVFLSDQFEFLQPHLDEMIPQTKKAFLQQFYSQTISTAQELRRPVYKAVASKSADFDHLLHQMLAVKWDIKDIMSQHSSYVDGILQEFQTFSNRLTEVSKRTPIPPPVYNVIWEHCIRLANKQLVEGYGSVKKCTNEGRALMQLDFQQFLMKLEKLTDMRPIPGRDYVESYIKAYYLPETQLELWVKEKKEYTPKQLVALINCVSHINKKARQRLVNIVEGTEGKSTNIFNQLQKKTSIVPT